MANRDFFTEISCPCFLKAHLGETSEMRAPPASEVIYLSGPYYLGLAKIAAIISVWSRLPLLSQFGQDCSQTKPNQINESAPTHHVISLGFPTSIWSIYLLNSSLSQFGQGFPKSISSIYLIHLSLAKLHSIVLKKKEVLCRKIISMIFCSTSLWAPNLGRFLLWAVSYHSSQNPTFHFTLDYSRWSSRG